MNRVQRSLNLSFALVFVLIALNKSIAQENSQGMDLWGSQKHEGAKVQVFYRDGHWKTGELLAVHAEEMLLNTADAGFTLVNIRNAMSIELTIGKSTKRGAALGGFLGLSGSTFFLLSGHENAGGVLLALAGSGLVGVGIGAAIGALINENDEFILIGMAQADFEKMMRELVLESRFQEVIPLELASRFTKQRVSTPESPTGKSTIVDTLPATIVILTPKAALGINKIETEAAMARVTGLVSKGTSVSQIYVDTVAATLTLPLKDDLSQTGLTENAMKFSADVVLAPGKNLVEVKTVGVNGRTTKAVLEIYRRISAAGTDSSKLRVPNQKLPNIWAVVIGISKYQDRALELHYADKDAQSVYGFLRSSNGGAVADERIDLLTNRNATRAEILRCINDKLRMAFDDDEVIIYMACHGIPDQVTGELYFLGNDSDPTNIVGTGISQLDIQKAISSARAKKVLFLADACHSGGIGLAVNIAQRGMYAESTNRLLRGIAQARDGVAMLTASSASEFSEEGEKWDGHGVFTYNLVKGLGGAADYNKDGIVTIREIYEYVYRTVVDGTGGSQHPDLQGKFDNQLPMSVVK